MYFIFVLFLFSVPKKRNIETMSTLNTIAKMSTTKGIKKEAMSIGVWSFFWTIFLFDFCTDSKTLIFFSR